MNFAKGFDMSRFQDNSQTPFRPDLKKARQQGMEFVIIRAIYCGTKDRDFEYNFKAARDAGFPVVGTYGFPDFRKTAHSEAAKYIDVLQQYAGEMGDCLAGDFEPIPGPTIGSIIPFPEPLKYRNWATEYMDDLNSIRPALFYANPNIIKSYMQVPLGHPLTKYPLWVANYYVNTPMITPWKTWTVWQYALGKNLGQQFGMESKDIDLDYYNGTIKDMQAWCKGAPPPLTLEQKVNKLWEDHYGQG